MLLLSDLQFKVLIALTCSQIHCVSNSWSPHRWLLLSQSLNMNTPPSQYLPQTYPNQHQEGLREPIKVHNVEFGTPCGWIFGCFYTLANCMMPDRIVLYVKG